MTGQRQPEAEIFGKRLRALREERGETQRSLGAATGISYVFIGDMERGLKVPSLTTLIRLAAALDCNITDLVDIFNGRDLRKLAAKRK